MGIHCDWWTDWLCAHFCTCLLIFLPVCACLSVCLRNFVYAWWSYERRRMLELTRFEQCAFVSPRPVISVTDAHTAAVYGSIFTWPSVRYWRSWSCTRHACCQVVQAWTNQVSLVGAWVSLVLRSLSAMFPRLPTHGVCGVRLWVAKHPVGTPIIIGRPCRF